MLVHNLCLLLTLIADIVETCLQTLQRHVYWQHLGLDFYLDAILCLKAFCYREMEICCCCAVTELCPTLMTPWTAACQVSLSITISQSLLKLMFIESVMTSNYLILCCPLLLLPSIFLSIRARTSCIFKVSNPCFCIFNFFQKLKLMPIQLFFLLFYNWQLEASI